MRRWVTSMAGVWAVVLLLTGCVAGTTGTHKGQVLPGPTYSATMATVDRVGVLVDAVTLYSPRLTNFVCLELSWGTITNLADEVRADLTAKGYEVAFVETPFIGGFVETNVPFHVVATRKDKPAKQKQSAPFQIMDPAGADAEYREALLTVLRDVPRVVRGGTNVPPPQMESSERMRAAMSMIAARQQIRFLLVVEGDGNVPSTGRKVSAGVGMAIFSIMATAGNLMFVAFDVSALYTRVGLVDLQTGEVVWGNHCGLSGLNPTIPVDYKAQYWARRLLYSLPVKGKTAYLPEEHYHFEEAPSLVRGAATGTQRR